MRLLLPILLLLPVPLLGQVTTDDQALKGLGPAPSAAAPASAAKPAPVGAAKPAPHRAVHRATPAHGAHPAHAAALPQVPAAPPPNPVIVPPPAVVPTHSAPVPPVVKPNPAAPTTVAAIDGGTRLVFGPGDAELNQASLDALEALAAAAKADPQKEISVTAWAPGVPGDPSTPHRLSLDRALAARAVLIHAGIVSDRIHAVAKGFNDIAGGPLDRMDVVAVRPRPTPEGKPTLAPGVTPKPKAPAKPSALGTAHP
jgi:outer membrane protein OmpA-like peptidoglycan-associated protein